MSALRKPVDVAVDLARSHEVNDKGEGLILVGIEARDREIATWLLRVRETAGVTIGGWHALTWAAQQIAPTTETAGEAARAPEPEEHPLDALRRLSIYGDVANRETMAYASHEIARLTDALAAAVRERDDARDDALAAKRAPCDDAPGSAPDPDAARRALVALASDIARAPMGQGLVITRTTMGSVSVDTAMTGDNAVAVARRILGAT